MYLVQPLHCPDTATVLSTAKPAVVHPLYLMHPLEALYFQPGLVAVAGSLAVQGRVVARRTPHIDNMAECCLGLDNVEWGEM